VAEFAGVMHVHSTYSDGAMSLPEISEWALADGLDFVCVTDHSSGLRGDRLEAFCSQCSGLSGETLLVPGVEFEHSGRHVLVIAPPESLATLTDETAVRNPELAKERGGLTIWAHPSQSYAISLRDAIATCYDGWEIWNLKVDGVAPSLPMLSLLRRLAEDRPLLPFAGLDAHERPAADGRPVLQVRTEQSELTVAALLESFRSGSYAIVSDAMPPITAGSPAIALPIASRLRSYARYGATRTRCAAAALRHRSLSGAWP
jgi:hypothetical protein